MCWVWVTGFSQTKDTGHHQNAKRELRQTVCLSYSNPIFTHTQGEGKTELQEPGRTQTGVLLSLLLSLLSFLGGHWLVRLCRFGCVARRLCAALCVHHPASALPPPPSLGPRSSVCLTRTFRCRNPHREHRPQGQGARACHCRLRWPREPRRSLRPTGFLSLPLHFILGGSGEKAVDTGVTAKPWDAEQPGTPPAGTQAAREWVTHGRTTPLFSLRLQHALLPLRESWRLPHL